MSIESHGLSAAQGGQGQAAQEAQGNRCHLRQHQKKDHQALEAGNIKRLSMDCKADGEFSRGGLTWGDNKACDHDFSGQEKYHPCGIIDEDSGQLVITFGSSFKSSDFIVDILSARWTGLSTQEQTATAGVQIKMDNGPESSGVRTQFLNRIVQFADPVGKPIQLLYYPPYHEPSTIPLSAAGVSWNYTEMGPS